MKNLWVLLFCVAVGACTTGLKSLEPDEVSGAARPLEIPPQADELPY